MDASEIVFEKAFLDGLYAKYNRREFVHPDPLEFLYNYDSPAEREIVGIVASSLAYGRVAQILKSVSGLLDLMGGSPLDFVASASPTRMKKTFSGFKHRFTTGDDLSVMLSGVKKAVRRHGSLKECFISHHRDEHETFLPALSGFIREISGAECGCNFLAPTPDRGSACKRLNLFLRWMVRRDGVDPGGWDELPASKLIVPIDTHMFGIGARLGLTARKQADLKAAVEITDAFKTISPGDPVKYDFALTRIGIRSGLNDE
jgi:uncharacterized protein (TIGR02757 family)